MDDKQLEELLKDNFTIKQGLLFEYVILNQTINQTFLTEILKRLIALEKSSKGELSDDDEYIELCDLIAERGTQRKNEIFAELFSKSD